MTTLLRVKPLLDFIGKYESGGDYDIVYGGIDINDRPYRALTSMTIREVLAWQDRIDARYPSEAAGKYQIMEDTLRDIYAPAGLTLDALFNASNQDVLALHLLRRRGLRDWLQGGLTHEHFGTRLAMEWASLPVLEGPKRGKSYYAGDGLNMSHVSVDEFLSVLIKVRDGGEPPKTEVKPEAQKPWWQRAFCKAKGLIA